MAEPLRQRAVAGDEAAFESLIRPLVEPGLRLALSMLGNRRDAEDATQEADPRVAQAPSGPAGDAGAALVLRDRRQPVPQPAADAMVPVDLRGRRGPPPGGAGARCRPSRP